MALLKTLKRIERIEMNGLDWWAFDWRGEGWNAYGDVSDWEEARIAVKDIPVCWRQPSTGLWFVPVEQAAALAKVFRNFDDMRKRQRPPKKPSKDKQHGQPQG